MAMSNKSWSSIKFYISALPNTHTHIDSIIVEGDT